MPGAEPGERQGARNGFLAAHGHVLTVQPMTKIRRRAFTLLETLTVMVVVAIVSTLTALSLAKVVDQTKDTAPQQAVRAVGGAQEGSWRTYGRFAEPDELGRLESAYTYVAGDEPSTGPRSISVKVSDEAGVKVVGIAALGESGKCYTAKQYQARAPRSLEDSAVKYTPSADQPCTGTRALSANGKEW